MQLMNSYFTILKLYNMFNIRHFSYQRGSTPLTNDFQRAFKHKETALLPNLSVYPVFLKWPEVTKGRKAISLICFYKLVQFASLFSLDRDEWVNNGRSRLR